MHRWHITVPDDLAERVSVYLDGRPLSAFVRRAVEQALGGGRERDGNPAVGANSVDTRAAGQHSDDATEHRPRPVPAEQREASEQALGSSGRAGVRGRVPALPHAEQPPGLSFDEAVAKVPPGHEAVIPVYANRVRSSSVARPFRPVPKKGEK